MLLSILWLRRVLLWLRCILLCILRLWALNLLLSVLLAILLLRILWMLRRECWLLCILMVRLLMLSLSISSALFCSRVENLWLFAVGLIRELLLRCWSLWHLIRLFWLLWCRSI